MVFCVTLPCNPKVKNRGTAMGGDKKDPQKFTDMFIKNLKPEATMYQVRSFGETGFGVRVLPSGLRIFVFIYTLAGKRRQMNLGSFPDVSLADARKRLLAARQAFVGGKDPQNVGFEWHSDPERERREREQREENDRKNPTVSQLFSDYMARHAKLKKRESSWREDERLFKASVEPQWGKRKASDIKKRDCVTLLDAYTDRPALCQNILSLTRKMFNFAVEKDILEHTPFNGVKVPVKVESRDRVLAEEEIRKLLTTELPKAAMSDEVKRIIRFLLLTGQRVGEVCGIHADEVDGHWWTIPASRTKNGQVHKVYLTDTALDLLGTPYNGCFYFPSPVLKYDDSGEPIYAHIEKNAVAYAIRRNLKAYKPQRPIKGDKLAIAEIPEDRKMELEHFTPHDLRRTFSTGLSALGFHDETIDAVTNHKKQGVIKVYNRHKYEAEKQQAMEAWDRKLSAIIHGTSGKVASIEAARDKKRAA